MAKLATLNDALTTALSNFPDPLDQDAYKASVMDLVTQLETARETMTQTNIDDAGLIRADVLEWSENREEKLVSYKNSLRHRLARLVGYESPLCSVENVF